MSKREIKISDVKSKILALHDELEAEHKALPANWIGRPRKRHHQIIGASRALKELWKRIDEEKDG